MELLQEDIKKGVAGQGDGRKQRWVTGWLDSRLLSAISLMARAFAADHPKLYQKYMGQSQTMRFTVK
ncbi:MAG: hypothetical protein ACLR0U_10410 [Enterocloster clostridioformis]